VEDVDFGQLLTTAAIERRYSLFEQVKGAVDFAHSLALAFISCSSPIFG
jgi:hypothetical protein